MKYILICSLLVFGNSTAYAVDFNRDDNGVSESSFDIGDRHIYAGGSFNVASDFDCSAVVEEDEDDIVLEFDISEMRYHAGNKFDVDDVYIDGISTQGEIALDAWKATFLAQPGLEYKVYPAKNDSNDWLDLKIQFCVGTKAQAFSLVGDFEEIVLWYDGDVQYPSRPLYRFYSDVFGVHFYTVDESERNDTINNPDWRYEGAAARVYSGPRTGALPVYRFWSDYYKRHFYTISAYERDLTIDNFDESEWRYEGVAFYAFDKDVEIEGLPLDDIYRFYSDPQGHFYTTSIGERDGLLEQEMNETTEYTYEGRVFRVPAW